MNILDFLILLPIAYFGYRGFRNGLIREVLSIIGIILAVFLTFHYMDEISSYIQPFFEADASYVPFIAALLIFIGTLIIVNVIAHLAQKVLETVHLNVINRIAGLAFGALKCGIIISALLLVVAGFNIPSEQTRNESVSYPHVIYLAPWAYDTVATVYPGAKDFVQTVQKSFENHNPIPNFPFLEP
jgi:membrane protein required for colicin V production